MYAEVVAQMLQNGEQIGHAGSIASAGPLELAI